MDVDGLEPERRHQSLVDSSASQGQYLGIKGQLWKMCPEVLQSHGLEKDRIDIRIG